MQGKTILVTESRIATAGLCVAVALIHVTDQGGFKALDDPTWLGWAYRALEVGATVVAVLVLIDALAPRLTALAILGVGAGPFIGYVLTRTTGVPQDTGDVGNWGDPLGIMSLIVEGTLVIVALLLLTGDRAPARAHELEHAAATR